MKLCTLNKFLCCIELKWGALIIGLVDLTLGLAFKILAPEYERIINIVFIIIVVISASSAILLITSVFVPKHRLVLVYLITTLFNLVSIIILEALLAVHRFDTIVMYIAKAVLFALSIYFWICIYSWYVEIGGTCCC